MPEALRDDCPQRVGLSAQMTKLEFRKMPSINKLAGNQKTAIGSVVGFGARVAKWLGASMYPSSQVASALLSRL